MCGAGDLSGPARFSFGGGGRGVCGCRLWLLPVGKIYSWSETWAGMVRIEWWVRCWVLGGRML